MSLTLDDRDPAFNYQGSWELESGDTSLEFNGTTTSTSVAGDTASLTFTGTQITVFGTIPAKGIEETRNTQLSAYSIDNGTKILYRGTLLFTRQYKQAFFHSDKLLPTINHTLTIENVGGGGTLSLDYVTIITNTPLSLPTAAPVPLPESSEPTTTSSNSNTESETGSQATMSSSPAPSPTTSEIPGNGSTITIDDRSPSLVYAGLWNTEGTSSELDGTATWSNMSNSTVSLNFSGSQISVWGTVLGIGNGTAPQSNYTIDDGTPTLFIGLQLTNTQYKQLFFQSDTLAPDNHTLNIETLVTGAYYYLDYITVADKNSTTTTTLVPISSSTTMSATATADIPSAKVGHAGVIVGGVLSGVIFIGIILGLAILWKRKQDSKNQRVDEFLITLPTSPGALQRAKPPLPSEDLKRRELPFIEGNILDISNATPNPTASSDIILD